MLKSSSTMPSDLKIIVVGDSGTGKTSFVNKWTKNIYTETYKATIMSEFGYKIYNHNGKVFRIQLWDIAGQDKSACITKLFCKDSHGAVVASDITRRQSLEQVLKWKNSIDENSKFQDGTDIPMILVENKCDLVEDASETETSFKEFWSKNKFINGFRTSSKNGINISESMDFLIKHIIDKLEKLYNVSSSSAPTYSGRTNTQEAVDRTNHIQLNRKNNAEADKKQKKNCC